MVDKRPDPPVPVDVDLRNFPTMPFDVQRLRQSRIIRRSSGEGFRAAVLLWCHAWHQVPASSLPNDDVDLADYAGFGRDLKAWKKVREEALHGFVLCSDDRLYHTVIAEIALSSWDKKVNRPDRTTERSERARRAAQARWANAPSNAQSMPDAMPEHPKHMLDASTEHAPSNAREHPKHAPSNALNRREEKGKEETQQPREHHAPSIAQSMPEHPKHAPEHPRPEALVKAITDDYDRIDRICRAAIPDEVSWPIKASPTVEPMPLLFREFDEQVITQALVITAKKWAASGTVPRTWGLTAKAVREHIEDSRKPRPQSPQRQQNGAPTGIGTGPNGMVLRADLDRQQEEAIAKYSDDTWERFVRAYRESATWQTFLGPEPNKPNCRAPLKFLEKYGYRGDLKPPSTETVASLWEAAIDAFRASEGEDWPRHLGPNPVEPNCRAPRKILEAKGYPRLIVVDGTVQPEPAAAGGQ